MSPFKKNDNEFYVFVNEFKRFKNGKKFKVCVLIGEDSNCYMLLFERLS